MAAGPPVLKLFLSDGQVLTQFVIVWNKRLVVQIVPDGKKDSRIHGDLAGEDRRWGLRSFARPRTRPPNDVSKIPRVGLVFVSIYFIR